MVSDVNLPPVKAYFLITVMLSGITKSIILTPLRQSLPADPRGLDSPLAKTILHQASRSVMSTLSNLLQCRNAPSPIVVILLGIVIVSISLSEKAYALMVVTGYVLFLKVMLLRISGSVTPSSIPVTHAVSPSPFIQ